MTTCDRWLVSTLCLVIGSGACAGALETDGEIESDLELTVRGGGQQAITYVGKETTTDFSGLGQHLQYWPLFGRTSPATARRTDDEDCIEITPDFADFKHHFLLEARTFSNDALGVPIGTKTRGGYANWATFTLPDGTTGRSGTFYDESNIDNSNNTVNHMRINVSTLSEFCLNLITDNTDGEHNPDVRFEARSDTVDLNLAGHPDHTFDGQTDMYTFRYTGMAEDDVFKIRIQCSEASGCQGAGLGGIMVSEISTCTENAGPDAGPDSGPGTDNPDAGEPDEPDDPASGGGCQSGGKGNQSVAFSLLLLVVLARRRRGGSS